MSKKSKGLIFEQAIISGVSEDTGKVPQEHVDNARKLLQEAGGILEDLPSQKQNFKFSEPGDPKTDIYFNNGEQEYKISVKYMSGIQLCSVNKNTVTKYFNIASNKSNVKSDRISNLVKSFESLPKKVLEEEYQSWAKNKRAALNKEMNSVLESNPKLKESLADVAITGKGLFKDTRAVANYILTETKLVKIDSDYIKKCAKQMKTDFRRKSRSNKKTGNREVEANFRIDLNMKTMDSKEEL